MALAGHENEKGLNQLFVIDGGESIDFSCVSNENGDVVAGY